MTDAAPDRRERLRRQTLDEISHHAVAQVTQGGVAALSLNAIAKSMGMSGPAIYRYYASRDELLAALVTQGYGELADAVQSAADAGRRKSPEVRLRGVIEAYRQWALANPYRYEMLFSVRPAGYADPHEAIAAIQPAMEVLLAILGGLVHASGTALPRPGGQLEAQLDAWATAPAEAETDHELSSAVLLLGVLTWTRLHGILTLELAGVVGDMGLDAGLLIHAELDAVVGIATGS
ncbi:TetR/AcrR family transcriptional regulator [Nocardioides sp. URHA0020]|uniref:TetR/AcrR family transcriptional regulator n=1 Tax=Nocardioides sp. URHA0020 TaxID=1380392 RepID=UPI00048AC2D3|nr:TetR/AcrR family transcriptional regulator [Nocardioides sp. URHA0020]